jgi:DNA gyrase subunit A
MRDEDGIQHILSANSHDSLLVFTNRGRVYQIKVYELPDAGRTAKGLPIVNVINMQPDEKVATLLKVRNHDPGQFLFFTTRQGRVKRTSLDQFRQVRSNGLAAITLDDSDELAWVKITNGECDVIMVTQKGMSIRFNESDARSMGRTAAGVIGIRLDDDDRVIAFDVIEGDKDLLVVSEHGMGKRTPIEQYRVQSRGGKGIQAMRLTNRTGDIMGAGMVTDEDAVMLMNSSGIAIRIAARQVSRIGRTTQGVKLMKLGIGESVASMTIIEPRDPTSTAQLGDLEESELGAEGAEPAS